MNLSDIDILIIILTWLLVGGIFLRTVYRAVYFGIVIMKHSGFNKSSILAQILVIVFWPIGLWVSIPVSYYVLKQLEKRNKKGV